MSTLTEFEPLILLVRPVFNYVDRMMQSSERISIPLLAPLIPYGIRPGTVFAVECDPASQWFAVATTLIAQFLHENRSAYYLAMARPPEDVKRDLAALGVDVPSGLKSGRLEVDDWYSATLTGGRLDTMSSGATTSGGLDSMHPSSSSLYEPIVGGYRLRSIKAADLSVEFLRWSKTSTGAVRPETLQTYPIPLVVAESVTEMARFNEENALVELMISRINAIARRAKHITLQGYVRGIHSESFYNRIENASDGVIDLRIMEREEEAKNLLR